MDDIDWSDRAFYDDGEWVTWSEIDEQLRYKEWGVKYPNAIRSMIPYFEDLISLAESYHVETGLHLAVYGDIGELFGAITVCAVSVPLILSLRRADLSVRLLGVSSSGSPGRGHFEGRRRCV